MNEKFRNITERLKKDKKPMIIMLMGFIGIFLLCISSFTGSENTPLEENTDVSVLQEELEKKLTSLIESIDGVGKAKVMITLDAYEEHIFAVNTESESSAEAYEYKEEYVLTESSGDTDGLTVKIIAPSVRGVGISCVGASSDVVKREITKLVSATLGISVNKIWVTAMEE